MQKQLMGAKHHAAEEVKHQMVIILWVQVGKHHFPYMMVDQQSVRNGAGNNHWDRSEVQRKIYHIRRPWYEFINAMPAFDEEIFV